MKRAARFKTGSVVFDKRRKTWNFLYWQDGKRRSRQIGTSAEYPTKGAAWRAVQVFPRPEKKVASPRVEDLIQTYKQERMPKRADTRRSYGVWLNNYILPRWGQSPITDLQARPVELWLGTLKLSPKSKVHIRGLISILWDYAMWRGDVPNQRNPMELVTIHGASKRTKQPRNLTVEEFQRLVQNLEEPFSTIALLCVCFGLRISECLALKWSDVDWLNSTLCIERGIVAQKVDTTKTDESRRQLPMDNSLVEALKSWRQATQFNSQDDWVFASPVQLGRLPWSYDQIWRVYQKAAAKAGIPKLGTHALRHTYRSWLDAVGTPIAVQQKLMRHADIRTTMNVYGDVVTDEMRQAHGKVVRLAFTVSQENGSQTDRKVS
jgi:integrase